MSFRTNYNQLKQQRGCRTDEDVWAIFKKEYVFDQFPISREMFLETVRSTQSPENPVIRIAFYKTFGFPFIERETELKFERKHTFLRFYEKQMAKGHTKAQVRRELHEHYHIPENTFDTTVDRNKLNLNAETVIAFCKLYGYDIYDIYRDEHPDAGEHTSANNGTPPSIQDSRDTINSQIPHSFEGKFYGYFLNSSSDYTRQGKIDQFTLNITNHSITMTLRHYAQLENKYNPRDIELQGRIIHNQGGASSSGILAIAFYSEDDRTFCTLAYNKFQLNGQLFYRKGAMLVQSRSEIGMPVIQSFIFTHRKMDLNSEWNRRIIQGALALPHKTIRIKKENLERFKDSEVIQKYFRKVTREGSVQEYIELDENIIRSLEIYDRDRLYETLLEIKSDAADPRLFIFPNDNEDRSWKYLISLCEEEVQEDSLEYLQEGPEA